MPNTIFLALQCCQCSIMQVKQQKKSSNKWTCVVCNQKQSVRKVFAQGYMAKDLRQFVQSFNLSQKDQTLTQQRQQQEEQEDDGFDPKIEVEMPLKKPKLESSMTQRASKWSKYVCEEDMEPGTCQATMAKDASHVDEEPKTFRPTITKPATSKWSNYMTQEDMESANCQATIAKDASDVDKEPKTFWPTITKPSSKWSRNCMTQDDYKELDINICQETITAKATSKWSDYITEEEDREQKHENLKLASVVNFDEWRNDFHDDQSRR